MAGSPVPWPVSPTSPCPCRKATLTVLSGSPTGSYEEAGTRLREALHPTSPSEAARARRGLLRLKKGDVPAASRDLQSLAETDAGDLGFLLHLLEASERQSLAQVPAHPVEPLRQPSPAPQALGLLCIPWVLIPGGGGLGGRVSRRHLGSPSQALTTPAIFWLLCMRNRQLEWGRGRVPPPQSQEEPARSTLLSQEAHPTPRSGQERWVPPSERAGGEPRGTAKGRQAQLTASMAS